MLSLSRRERARLRLNQSTHRIAALPVLVLMPHSSCNCACVMCDIWKSNRNKTEIAVEQIEPHLEAFRRLGVRNVALSGGEALLHSNLWTFCRLLRRLDISIQLLSTGLLLDRHAQDVVRHCHEVIVSLDGSPPVHDAIRRIPRAFERLAEGVAALKAAQPGYRVTARCVLQKRNCFDLAGIIQAARRLGVDQLSFLPVDVSSEAFNRPGGWDDTQADSVALSATEAEGFSQCLEETLRQQAQDFESGFIAESPEKMRRIADHFRARVEGRLPEAPRCNAPWVSSVIESDGTVRPCFFHPPLGNIHERPLESILNSPQAVRFRSRLKVDEDPVCRRCVCSLHLETQGPLARAARRLFNYG